MTTTLAREAAAGDHTERLLRLDALQRRLHGLGKATRVRAETPTCWALLIRTPARPWPLPRLRIYCAGADGTYFYVTAGGRILSHADTHGVRTAAALARSWLQ